MASLCFRRNGQSFPCTAPALRVPRQTCPASFVRWSGSCDRSHHARPGIEEDCRHREHTDDERRHDPADKFMVSCIFAFKRQQKRLLFARQLRRSRRFFSLACAAIH